MAVFDVPLIDAPRQSAVVRLSGLDCRMTVWWQPPDAAWFWSLEVPQGTPLVSGRRVVVNVDLLAGILSRLPGRLVCVPLQAAATEPGPRAWGDTHAIRYEVA